MPGGRRRLFPGGRSGGCRLLRHLERLTREHPTARKRLGKYVLLGRLGHGGMGKIYLAFAPGPGGIEKLLVIKRIRPSMNQDRAFIEMLLHEARIARGKQQRL